MKVETDITLNENGELLLKYKDVTDIFNKYFGSIIELLDLYKWESEISDLGLNDSIRMTWISLYLSMKNVQVYKWLNRILEFLRSFYFNLSPRMRSKI